MATYINLAVGGDDLRRNAKAQQRAARSAFLEKERKKKLEQEVEKNEQEEQGRKLKPNPFSRKLIAHRHPGDLTPLAVSWRGVWDPEQPFETTNDQLGQAPSDEPWEFRYQGSGSLDPNPIRFASTSDLSSVTQGIRSVIGSVEITSHVSGIHITENYENYWVNEVQHGESSADPWVVIEPTPSLETQMGVGSYSPTDAVVSVGEGGIVFIVIRLPVAPRSYSTMTYNDWNNAGNPLDTVVTEDRRDKTVAAGYSPWKMMGTFWYAPDDEVPTPYLFLRIDRGAITEQQAERAVGEDYGDFYRANCFDDDPSAGVRGTFNGWYQVLGNVARIVRLRADGAYSEFPFGGLTQYFEDEGGVPRIPANHIFEEHRYNLADWADDDELAALLNDCVEPGGAGTVPSGIKNMQCQPALYSRARTRMGSDEGDYVTGNHYLLYPL